jgi:HK97 family phage major capsid protein
METMKTYPASNGGARQGSGFEFKEVQIDASKNELKHFWDYIRTGRQQEYIKTAVALNEADAEQGGVLIPTDFYNKIVAKRDEISIMRSAGATVIQTSLKTVDIPVEGVREAKFVVPGEATAYDENAVEPFDKVTASILKYTRLVKMSEELVEDQAANLEPFFADRLSDAPQASPRTTSSLPAHPHSERSPLRNSERLRRPIVKSQPRISSTSTMRLTAVP